MRIKEALDIYENKKENRTILLIGGTGFFENDGGRNLHPEIEHIRPDYDLYLEYVNYKVQQGRPISYFDDYLNYSIGFTSRGCFRKCHFCINRKYDHAFIHSPVEEFIDNNRPMIYLWDDNIFALRDGWEDIFDQLIKTHKPFQFRQGLDIRMLQEKHAKKLCNCKYHGDFIFAFDHVDQSKLIEQKLQLWRKYCGKTTKLYVLCAFDSWDYEIISNDLTDDHHHYFLKRMNNLKNQDARDQEDIEGVFERIKILMKYGCLPYIMRFQNYKLSKYCGVYTQLARWCNQPQFFKKKSFRQFCEANRKYSQSDKCAAYQAMIDFEKDRPDIAKKYFDMRYDIENECIVSYGRKITHSCSQCLSSKEFMSWEEYMKGCDKKTFLSQYFSGNLDIICIILKKCPECKIDLYTLSQKIDSDIENSTPGEILSAIDNFPEIQISPDTIPQISGIELAIFDGLNRLIHKSYTFLEFGKELPNRTSNNDLAMQKFGENHAKLLSLMDLAYIDKSQKPNMINITPLGKIIQGYNLERRRLVSSKLILKIPVIQNILRDLKTSQIKVDKYLSPVLKDSTVERRSSTIRQLLDALRNLNSVEINTRLEKLIEDKKPKNTSKMY